MQLNFYKDHTLDHKNFAATHGWVFSRVKDPETILTENGHSPECFEGIIH